MKNPVFNLIAQHKTSFISTFYIEQKTAQSGALYFLLKPKLTEQTEFISHKEQYTITAWHISVYVDLRIDEGHGQSSYHLTLDMVNSRRELSSMRIYFNSFNKLLYANQKDVNQVITTIENVVSISQLARTYIKEFYDKFWVVYMGKHNVFELKYNELMHKLENTSKELESYQDLDRKGTVWEAYQSELQALLKHMEDWHLFELNPNISTYNYLGRLLEHVAMARGKIEIQRQVVIQPRVEEINKQLVDIDSDIKITPSKKKIRKHSLLKEKIKHDDVYLENLLAIRELEKELRRMFAQILLLDTAYNQVSIEELTDLIKKLPFVSFNDFFMAVKHNRLLALELLIQCHPNANLEQPVSNNNNLTLLEFAYENKLTECFCLLLKADIACDNRDKNGDTLLIKACTQGRKKEMVALLHAGASHYIRNRHGFTAFAMLTMNSLNEPDLDSLQSFIDNCKNFDIDFMQGPIRQRQTPLSYSCQKGRLAAVKFLLLNNANPTFIRQSDGSTALSICAAKGFTTLAETILKLSIYDLKNICAYALKVAELSKQLEVKDLLEQYMQERNISKEVVVQFLCGGGTSMVVMEELLRQKPKDNSVELSALLKNMWFVSSQTTPQIGVSSKNYTEEMSERTEKTLYKR